MEGNRIDALTDRIAKLMAEARNPVCSNSVNTVYEIQTNSVTTGYEIQTNPKIQTTGLEIQTENGNHWLPNFTLPWFYNLKSLNLK